jgi:hypothetical protein
MDCRQICDSHAYEKSEAPPERGFCSSGSKLPVEMGTVVGTDQAEGEGFEPSTHLSARTRFPVALLRPLGHPSERRPS